MRPGVVGPVMLGELEEEGSLICPGSGEDMLPLSQEWRERGAAAQNKRQ